MYVYDELLLTDVRNRKPVPPQIGGRNVIVNEVRALVVLRVAIDSLSVATCRHWDRFTKYLTTILRLSHDLILCYLQIMP